MWLFVQGSDGALWYGIWYPMTTGWSQKWISLGGILTSSPCVVSRQDGSLDVFVRGTTGALWTRSYNNGAWGAWTSLGGQIAAGTGPGASGWSGRLDVFVAATTGALYQKTWTAASGWSSSWTNLGGNLKSSPAVAMQPHAIEIVARWSNDYICLKEYYSGAWHNWMQTAFQGPP